MTATATDWLLLTVLLNTSTLVFAITSTPVPAGTVATTLPAGAKLGSLLPSSRLL